MPGQFGDSGETDALNAVVGRAAVSTATYYLALYTTSPTDTAGGTEYAATGYARQTLAGATSWNAPTSNGTTLETQNTNAITFGPFTASTGATVSHVALMTTSGTGTGVPRAWWSLDTSRTPATGDSLQFAAGALKLAVD